jgi:hypothetical protein
MMIQDRFQRNTCNNLHPEQRSLVTQVAVLAQELFPLNALHAAEVLNLMQLAARAVRTFMIPLIQNVDYVIILVLLVVLALRQAVFLVNQDLP